MPDVALGRSQRSFGHGGMGGALGFADLEAKVGFGYTMNQMQMRIGTELIDRRLAPLIEAVFGS